MNYRNGSSMRTIWSQVQEYMILLTVIVFVKSVQSGGTNGIEAFASVMKEMLQLHEKGVWISTKYENIGDKKDYQKSVVSQEETRW